MRKASACTLAAEKISGLITGGSVTRPSEEAGADHVLISNPGQEQATVSQYAGSCDCPGMSFTDRMPMSGSATALRKYSATTGARYRLLFRPQPAPDESPGMAPALDIPAPSSATAS
jgi:hypothetical protein